MEIYLVHIKAESIDELQALDKFELDLKHRAARQVDPQQFIVPGILTSAEVERVEAAGYIVDVVSDFTKVAQERVQDVSVVNRFADARSLFNFEERTVLGYMTSAEVDSALINLHTLHPDLITLIKLPYKTWEGQTCHAVRLRAGTASNGIGVLFTGGMHAREWGGSDICISFLVNLINAYRANTALTYGSKTFTANQVRTILECMDVFVFPNVNPDGKNYSQTYDPASGQAQRFWWRKNRNPNTAANGASRGVDLNRNFNFLWNSGIGTSNSPTSFVYKGSAPFSEPETKNVCYLLNTYTHIRYFVDIHSFGELILYSWGDDDNQNTNLSQNFRNPVYDGQRGVAGDAKYREFISTLDMNTALNLATRMNDALVAVRGRRYTIQQAVGLYPTSGTSDDYAFSRHLVDGLKHKVYAFTLEFGTEFVPPYSEMQNVIKEVSAAITEFCWTLNSDVYIRDNLADMGGVPSTVPFWNSPDIWVRNQDDGGTTHQNTIRGRDNFVYVRVHNRGPAEVQDLKVQIYLANFAGTQFLYPSDWIPRNPSGGGSLSGSGTYLIGQAQVPALPSGNSQIVSVRWAASLIPAATWHPCLLVEVSPNDGPVGGNYVWQNNNLGQKNITIVNALAGKVVKFPFKVGNKLNPAKMGELVLKPIQVPPTVGIYLDVNDPALLESLKPDIIDFSPPAIIPPVWYGGTATLLHSTTVAISALTFSGQPQQHSLICRLPANTQVEFQNKQLAGLFGLPSQPGRLDLVTIDNKPQLSFSPLKEGKLPLPFKPGQTKEMTLAFAVPADATVGDRYELEVAQYDDNQQIVGGVTLQVNVVADETRTLTSGVDLESWQENDLTGIEGIGPKTSALLQAAGITSFSQLAAMEVDELKELLKNIGLKRAIPDTWPEQARLAYAGEWDALEALQNELRGGRRVK